MTELHAGPVEPTWHVMLKREVASEESPLQPGEYRQCERSEFPDHRILAIWCCPRCGKTCGLGSAHEVRLMGHVVPRIRCAHDCGFAVAMYLDEWHPPARGNA